MEQSSLEFLINHILHSEFETDEEWKEVFEQAKKMYNIEKQKAFEKGQDSTRKHA